MKKIMIVVGTRPDAIKMAPVYLALRQQLNLQVILLSTGQHCDLIHDALDPFGIHPDIDLGLMDPSKSLSALTAAMVQKIEQCLKERCVDLVLGHGDTATAFAAALASFYSKIPFYHVEAGLRSGQLYSPFPEEFHRRAIAQISAHHFAPTYREQKALLREGVNAQQISVIGNTIHDSLRYFLGNENSSRTQGSHVTITLHRRELEALSLRDILQSLNQLARDLPHVEFVFPLHPSPRIQDVVHSTLNAGNFLKLMGPLPYPSFLQLLQSSALVITDSGGVQEEAAYLGIRQLILRSESERVDGLGEARAELVGRNANLLAARARALLMTEGTNHQGFAMNVEYISPSLSIATQLRKELGLAA